MSIGGRPICNLRLADDMDLIGGSSGELQDLTNRLVDKARAYGMEVSTEKNNVMIISTNNISTDISINGQKLDKVTSFKYVGATLRKYGTCSAEIRIRIASAMAAMARVNGIWRYNTISFANKFKLYALLSLPSTSTEEKHGPCLLTLKKSIQIFETQSLRKVLLISYLEHKTNDWMRSEINVLVGPQEPLPATVKRRKLTLFRHVTRHNSLSKTILQGTLEDVRRRGRQRKCWMDNIKEWTSLPLPELLTRVSCKKILKKKKKLTGRRSLLNRPSCPSYHPPPTTHHPHPRRPGRSRDWTEINWIKFHDFIFSPRVDKKSSMLV